MIDADVIFHRPGFGLDAAFTSEGGVTALFGRSGSGKTTLLNAMAGLIRPQRGHIRLDGEVLFDAARRIFVPAHRRRIGLVFQDAQLFPHLSVRQNLTYGRWFTHRTAGRMDFDTVINVLGIATLLARRPGALSGGEKQRVAIGRALLAAPRLLLMDEPLASLDTPRKLEILALIERVRDEMKVPILYVSHAMEEVARLASRIVMLDGGKVTAIGSPQEVLGVRSVPLAEQRFDGVSVVTAVMHSYDAIYGLSVLEHAAGPISVPGNAGVRGASVRVVIRGSDISLATQRPEGISIRTMLPARIRLVVDDAGPITRVDLALTGGDTLSAFVTRLSAKELDLKAGANVYAMVKAASIDG